MHSVALPGFGDRLPPTRGQEESTMNSDHDGCSRRDGHLAYTWLAPARLAR